MYPRLANHVGLRIVAQLSPRHAITPSAPVASSSRGTCAPCCRSSSSLHSCRPSTLAASLPSPPQRQPPLSAHHRRRPMDSSHRAMSISARRSSSSSSSSSSSPQPPQGPGSRPAASRPANDLIHATSPYLVSHAYDPVDWKPWNAESLQLAKSLQRPIFLSVGYSACHWCHVMQHQSFQDEDIARQLNDGFVSIKVDREERPDVDAAYMTVVQAVAGRGGWPMSVFLTPDAEPIFGGTYFPPPTFRSLLGKISDLWTEDRENCIASSRSIAEQLRAHARGGPRSDAGDADATGGVAVPPSPAVVSDTVDHWLDEYDKVHHGFGSAPKFPSPALTHHLLHRFVAAASSTAQVAHNFDIQGSQGATDSASAAIQDKARRALRASVATLLAIGRGGIRDHLGGGIARYSVDDEFRVPHFEIMCYDVGQLLVSYMEAARLCQGALADETLRSAVPELHEVGRGLVDYLDRYLSNEAGGFFASEDADSLPSHDATEKREGAFYVWDYAEALQVLGGDESSEAFRLVKAHFGLLPRGNISEESDPHGELRGKNMLHATTSVEETARTLGMEGTTATQLLAQAKEQLLAHRSKVRPRPHLDDKVVCAWNWLAVSGLVQAAQTLPPQHGGSKALDMAVRATRFVCAHMWHEAGGGEVRLLRSWRNGVAGPAGFDVDYAFGAQAMLDLYQVTSDEAYLRRALQLQAALDANFWDAAQEGGGGGYFMSTQDGDGNQLGRQKGDQDGAEPTSTSVAAHTLGRLANLFSRPDDALGSVAKVQQQLVPPEAGGVARRAAQCITSHDAFLRRAPHAIGTRISATLQLRDPVHILVLGAAGSETTRRFLDAARRRSFLPTASIVLLDVTDGAAGAKAAQRLLYEYNDNVRALLDDPRTDERRDQTSAHICRGTTCGAPVSSLEEWESALAEL